MKTILIFFCTILLAAGCKKDEPIFPTSPDIMEQGAWFYLPKNAALKDDSAYVFIVCCTRTSYAKKDYPPLGSIVDNSKVLYYQWFSIADGAVIGLSPSALDAQRNCLK